MIEFKDLSKSFGDVAALQSVSLAIDAGECVGLIGPNGAGKTTTLRILATLTKPDSGTARVAGHDLAAEPREVRKLMGFLPDVFESYGDLRVLHFLDYYAAMAGLRGSRRRRTVQEVLELVDLTPKSDAAVHSLSRGVKQRLCLAKTLLHDPAVLLLDEPASGLDPRARIEIRALLQTLREMGKTILISSHILSDLDEICDRVAIVEGGRFIKEGSVTALKAASSERKQVRVQLRGDAPEVEKAFEILSAHPLVGQVTSNGNTLVIQKADGVEDLTPAMSALIDAGMSLVSFAEEEAGLEQVFLEATRGEIS